MIVLSLNSGSSSLKASIYQLHDAIPSQIASAQVSGLTSPPAKFTYIGKTGGEEKSEVDVDSSEAACHYITKRFIEDADLEEIKDADAITHICHRVVHGGEYSGAQVIDGKTLHHLEALTDLAPLHNASALAIIKDCIDQFPSAKNIAYFDTSYHTTLSPAIYTYPINQDVARKNRLRKYGFHGLSYSYIVKAVAPYLEQNPDNLNLIALHLGSGASVCAIRNGKSIDTSMGLTPLAGLPGATRSGDVDPSLIFHFTHNAGQPSRSSSRDLHISAAEQILNQESGWKALTGTTDFGSIQAQADQGDEKCGLAEEVFIDRVVGYIGNYHVKLDGQVHALVFAGGIGEQAVSFRQKVVERCRCLGYVIDRQANSDVLDGNVKGIGGSEAMLKVLICKTDEQLEMAQQCACGIRDV